MLSLTNLKSGAHSPDEQTHYPYTHKGGVYTLQQGQITSNHTHKKRIV